MSTLIKIAFGSVPKDGGTFTFYRNMRTALLKQGIDLRCVTVGTREFQLLEDAYIDEGCVLLASDTDNVKKQALEFVTWCVEENIDIVMAINSVAILSALPYLPASIRVVARCANAFDEGYRVTMSGRERLMRIIALTPRLRDDLVADYNADPKMIDLIPNGIDPGPFRPEVRGQKSAVSGRKSEVGGNKASSGERLAVSSDVDGGSEASEQEQSMVSGHADSLKPNHLKPNTAPKIQLGFLGRLEHRQKGVLYLPEIVRELKKLGVDFHLRIAGKGKHRDELEEGLKPFIESGEVELIGALTKDEVPSFLNSIDVYLFTSHFEGCPNTLLEAMMAGAAPVAFLIDGITDFVLKQGQTGFIAPMGDCAAFAAQIDKLMKDRELMVEMKTAAVKDALERFVPEVAAAEYARVFKEVMAAPLPDFDPLPWIRFRIDAVYRASGWRRFVPSGLKSVAKRVLRFKF